MHADGRYAYTAAATISLPTDGGVQDSFTLTIGDGHGDIGSVALAMTVMRPGDCYIGATPGTTVTGAGYTTVIDASLSNQTVRAGDGDDAVIGGPNDTIMVGNGRVPSTNFGRTS